MTILLEDLTLPHQIVLRCLAMELTVTCTCTATWPGHGGRPRLEVIEARTRFPAADALAAWRAWHQERGVKLS